MPGSLSAKMILRKAIIMTSRCDRYKDEKVCGGSCEWVGSKRGADSY